MSYTAYLNNINESNERQQMIKFIILLSIINPLYANSVENLAKSFMIEIESYMIEDESKVMFGKRKTFGEKILKHMEINNKLLLLLLIDKMKERKEPYESSK